MIVENVVRKKQFYTIVNNFYETSQRRKMTRGVFTRLVSPMIYIGIWQDLFEHRVGNPITINLARFFTFLSNFTQLQAGYLSNSLKREKEKVEEEEREKETRKFNCNISSEQRFEQL